MKTTLICVAIAVLLFGFGCDASNYNESALRALEASGVQQIEITSSKSIMFSMKCGSGTAWVTEFNGISQLSGKPVAGAVCHSTLGNVSTVRFQ
jgi:hypothetical protein